MIPSRMIAAIFALYAGLAVLLLALQMPPFMNPDENAHAKRADQIAHFGLVAHGHDRNVDGGVPAGFARTQPLVGRQEAKISRGMYAPLGWGTLGPLDAPNTAIYPPVFYLPAATAIWVARHLGWTVLPAMTLARMATGLASVALGTCAVALAGNATVFIFAVLLLPMSLAQMAAISQDGPMIACAALSAALCIRLRDPIAAEWRGKLAALCLCLAAIAMARPPYAAFALLPLATRAPSPARLAGTVFSLAAAAAWWWMAATRAGVDLGHFHGNDSAAQLLGLLTAPWRIPVLAWHTLALHGCEYVIGFVGMLGWLDVALPLAYVKSALLVLGISILAAWLSGAGKAAPARLVVLSCAVACAAIFAIQYLTWTAVGANAVEGVQGRYFLVPALLAGIVLARPNRVASRLATALTCLVLLFPMFSIAMTIHRITLRYYF
jgi:uncharacterized membrane protein